jgi:hypothetical protein
VKKVIAIAGTAVPVRHTNQVVRAECVLLFILVGIGSDINGITIYEVGDYRPFGATVASSGSRCGRRSLRNQQQNVLGFATALV